MSYEEESFEKLMSVSPQINKFVDKYSDLVSDFVSDVLESDNGIDLGDEILSLCIFRAVHTSYVKILALTLDEDTIHIAVRDICKTLLHEIVNEKTMNKKIEDEFLKHTH